MKRMKTFFIYLLIGLALYIWSDILIFLNLNSTYDRIVRKDYLETQVITVDAKATLVNGYVIGKVQNEPSNNLNGKFIKIDLYSSLGNVLGTKYIAISNLTENGTMNFEVHFKLQDIESYSISIVEEAGKEIDDSFYDEEISEFTKMITILGIKFTLL